MDKPTHANPNMQMMQLLAGRWVATATSIAAKLGLADLLAEGPKTAEELAAAVSAHAPSLSRLLTLLASVDVFAEDDSHRFSNTPLSETLRTGSTTVRGLAVMFGERPFGLAWVDLMHSVKTGESAFGKANGAQLFEYFERDPSFAAAFGDGMTARSITETEALLDVLDVSGVNTLADVAGGHGYLISQILKKHPHLRGILMDIPKAIEGAKPLLDREGVRSRCETVSGDFFVQVPPGADAYVLKHILHDWNDEKCVAILSKIREASKPGTRLIVMDAVIEPGGGQMFSKVMNLMMLVMSDGGVERTRDEWQRLLGKGGFTPGRFVPTPTGTYLIEATRD